MKKKIGVYNSCPAYVDIQVTDTGYKCVFSIDYVFKKMSAMLGHDLRLVSQGVELFYMTVDDKNIPLSLVEEYVDKFVDNEEFEKVLSNYIAGYDNVLGL